MHKVGIDQKTAEETVLMLMTQSLEQISATLENEDLKALAEQYQVSLYDLRNDYAAIKKEIHRQREILQNKLMFVRRKV